MLEPDVTKSHYRIRRAVYSGTRRVPNLVERQNADGSIVWEARFRDQRGARRVKLKATSKTEAIVELANVSADGRRGYEYRSPALGLSVEGLLDQFVAHMWTRVDDPDEKRRRARKTVVHYEYLIRHYALPVIGGLSASDLVVKHVRQVISAMAKSKLSPGTRTGTIQAMSSMLRYGMKEGIVDRNVVRDLDRDDRPGSRRKKEPRYLTLGELRQLLCVLTPTMRAVAATCMYAGLRHSEALGLRWSDLDLREMTVTVNGQLGENGIWTPYVKSNSSGAAVTIVPALAAELRAYRQFVAENYSLAWLGRDRLAFTTKTGGPLGKSTVLKSIHRAGDATGLNKTGASRINVHTLRHSFIGIMLQDPNLSLAEVSKLARHASLDITARAYGGISEEAKAQLASKLRKAFDS